MAPNRYWKAMVLVSGDVWHSFETDFPFYYPNENPLPRKARWPFSLSCAPLACVAHLYLKISVMSHVKRFEKGSRVWDASHLLPQAGREKRKALALSTHYRCKARHLQIHFKELESPAQPCELASG